MSITDFLRWWWDQLVGLVPDGLRRSWQGDKTAVTLKISERSLTFTGPRGAVVECPVPQTDQAIPPPALTDFLDHLPGSPQQLTVELGANQYLKRTLSLPRAARDHLAETVGYQLPRLTPFPADEVLYACGSDPGTTDNGPLPVWLVVFPRQRIARALALAGLTPPDNPLRLKQPPADGQPVVFSWQLTDPELPLERRIRPLWVGLLALWILAVALHLYNRNDAREQLSETLDGLRAEAAQVIQLRQRLSDQAAQLSWIRQREENTPNAIELLDSLSHLLDDTTSLQRFDFDGTKLRLTGTSATPASLIETLETSAVFDGVRFEGLTRDRRDAVDRFNISATIEEARPTGDGQ